MRPVAYWKSTAVPAQKPASASAGRRRPSHAKAKAAIAQAAAASCSKKVGASEVASVAAPKIAAVAAPAPATSRSPRRLTTNTATRKSTPDVSTRISHRERSPFASHSVGAFATPVACSSSNAGTASNDIPGALSEYVCPWKSARSNRFGSSVSVW